MFRATGHEHLSGSLVIPVGDVNGEVVQLYGRKLRDDLNHRGSSRHLYLPGPRRGVFNAKALAGCGGELIVCESLIDALTFWRHGLRHVTAAFGADGFTEELHTALKDAGIGRVLIAFDRDEAGDRGATALADRLGAEGVECFRVLFPAGQDANSFATSVGEPAGALAQLLREAVWIGAGEPAARPAPAPVEPERGGARAQLEQQGNTEGEREQGDPPSAAKAARSVSPPPSSPVPRSPGAQPVVKLDGDELRVEIEDRRWRIRGLGKASSFELLRVNVLVARTHPRRGEVFHVDSLDLYSARARGVFARQAGEELGVAEELVARDLGRVLLTCEEHAERAVREAQAPREPEVQVSEQERERALELLKDPALVERIVADFERVGMVGEQENCLIGYLAAVSRKLDRPLAVIVQSTSAAGKSALQEAVLSMVPEEERVSFSAMTGQSLFYYTVRGPVAIMLTTTTIDVDEELLNRCVVLSVDEEREQTRAIHERQRERETLDGLLADHEHQVVVKLHQDAQRLLEPLAVVNPFARALTFSDARTRTRRDHMKYLTLIRVVALLHQHQRPRRTASTADGGELVYIEATREDILLANRLAHAVLGRSLDELPPGTRRLLSLIEQYVDRQAAEQGTVRERVRFTRRELREALGWGDTQLKVHLGRLASLELLWCQRGPRGSYAYELAWDGAGEGETRLPGLIDPDELDAAGAGEGHGYDRDRQVVKTDRSGGGRPPVGGRSGRGRAALKAVAAG